MGHAPQQAQRHFIIDAIDDPGAARVLLERVHMMPATVRSPQLHVDEARLGSAVAEMFSTINEKP